MEVRPFSITANVCAADSAILKYTVANWLRVFADKLVEVLLIVDERPRTGRMLAHHKQRYTNRNLYSALEQIVLLDSRIRYVAVDYRKVKDISLKWFGESAVIRCQSGSPIFAYAFAIESAKSDIILRIDCDMLFFDNGWLDEGINLLESGTLDLVEPPKLGMNIHPYRETISTGALMLKRSAFFARCIPMKAYHLDWARRFHRYCLGKPTWLSLEEMFKKEKDRKRIRHELLDSQLGFSLHVFSRDYAHRQDFERVIGQIESGFIPSTQISEGWNLVLDLWPDSATS